MWQSAQTLNYEGQLLPILNAEWDQCAGIRWGGHPLVPRDCVFLCWMRERNPCLAKDSLGVYRKTDSCIEIIEIGVNVNPCATKNPKQLRINNGILKNLFNLSNLFLNIVSKYKNFCLIHC